MLGDNIVKKKVIVWGTGKSYEMQRRFIEDEFYVIGYIDCNKTGTIKIEEILNYKFDYIYFYS